MFVYENSAFVKWDVIKKTCESILIGKILSGKLGIFPECGFSDIIMMDLVCVTIACRKQASRQNDVTQRVGALTDVGE